MPNTGTTLVSVAEAVRTTGVCRAKIMELAASGQIRTFTPSKRVKIVLASLVDHINGKGVAQ